MKNYTIKAIDAWGAPFGGWEYNNTYNMGEIELTEKQLDSNRLLLKALRENEYLSEQSKGKLKVYDTGFSLEIQLNSNEMPLIVIEY